MNVEQVYRGMLNGLDGGKGVDGLSSPLKNMGAATEVEEADFSAQLTDAMDQFMHVQAESDQAITSLVLQEDGVEMHDVMIKATEAQLALDLAVQVRNKCLEAYNDIKNMQF